MSASTFIDAVFAAWKAPDAWDAGGAAFTGPEQAFREFGELVAKQKAGLMNLADGQRLDAVAKYLSTSIGKIAAAVSAIDVPAVTPDEIKLKSFIASLAQQGQKLVQGTGLLLDEIAAGSSSAAQRLSNSAASLLKFGGTLLAVTQVGMAYYFDGADEGAKKLVGALAGMGGAAVGAWLGGALVTGLASAAGVVASALAVSAGAVLGAGLVGFAVGKAFEESYSHILTPILGEMFDKGGAAYAAAQTFWSDSLTAMGHFDGTWLESPALGNLSDEDKAQLSTLFAGASQLQASPALYADINKLFGASFGSSNLISRDVLINSVLRIAQEQRAYPSERVSVNAGVIALDFPPGAPMALDAMRELIRGLLSEADQAGFSLRGPSRVVIAPEGGTLAALDGKDNLLIGGGEVDGLIGGDGADDLIAGGGDDTLLGGGNTDDLFGGEGNDLLDGGEGSDYLRGGSGNDTYKFSGSWASDTIIDSDGQGQIEIDGIVLQGGKKVAEGVWLNREQGILYTLVGTGPDQMLLIQRDSSLNSIRVRGWQSGNLGLSMDDEEEELPEPSRTFNGDQRALIRGIEIDFNIVPGDPRFNTYKWSDVTWATDGTLNGGVAEEDFNDVIDGGAGNDIVNGLGGNDALDGLAGNDEIDGGAGDDLIGGGAGSDTIKGGAGKDVILSATGLNVNQRIGPDDQWVPPGGTTAWIAGSNWGVYTSASGGRTIVGGGSLSMDTAGDIVDAGDGDDIVIGGLGTDYVEGGNGDDSMWGHGGNDSLIGGAGADYILGDGIKDLGFYQTMEESQHGNDFLDGQEGDDTLKGGGANDVLYGGLGADLLWGDDDSEDELAGSYHGDDYLDGEAGNDQLVGGGGDDELYGGANDDSMWGDDESEDKLAGIFHGSDYLDGEDGADYLVGGGGDDTLFGGTGADTLRGDDTDSNVAGSFHGADYLDGEDGDDQLVGGGGDDTLLGGKDDDLLLGDDQSESQLAGEFHGNDYLNGEDGDDQLAGGGKDDTLHGGAGKDRIWGDSDEANLAGASHGNDYLDGGADDDILVGGGKNDILFGGEGNDELQGDAATTYLSGSFHGDDYLDGGVGNDRLFGLGRNDTLLGRAGDDYLSGDGAISEVASEFHGNDYLDGGDGNDVLFGGGGDDVLEGGAGNDFLSGEDQQSNFSLTTLAGNDTLYGGDGDDTLLAGSGDNYLSGDAGDDTLWGGDGNDLLVGGAGNDFIRSGRGNDVMDGGAGNDTYYVALGSGRKRIQDDNGQNTLILEQGFTFAMVRLSLGSLVIGDAAGTSEIHLDGVDYDDLAGTSPIQQVQFSDGTTMSIAQLIDAVSIDIPTTENSDTVRGTSGREVIHALAGDDVVDGRGGNDMLDLGAGNDIGHGGDGDDTILGADGNDTIDGGAGGDELNGGMGADTLFGGAGSDRLEGGAGDDTLFSGDGDYNHLDGGDGNDVLHGGSGLGNDLRGGVGNDMLLGGDGVNEQLDGGDGDDVLSGGLGIDHLFGGSGIDQLDGGEGADQLDGGQGADAMSGGAGDDEYFVDNAGDTVNELSGEGHDIVFTTIDLVLSENVEELHILQDSQATNATGNSLDNVFVVSTDLDSTLLGLDGNDTLQAGGGDDLLDGGEGSDRMEGWSGNDEYRVDNVDDQVVEYSYEGAGIDSVFSSVSFSLSSNVENLTLVGSTAIQGFGNASNNTITGNAQDNYLSGGSGDDVLVGGEGADWLDGGAWTDTLVGGVGDDVYEVDIDQDVIVELQNEGNDTVRSAVDYVLGANLENLSLTGQATNATGNAGDNILLGNGNDNRLDGAGGEDHLEGGFGNDTYVIDSTGDVVVELEGEGLDTVEIGRSFSVAEIANVENVTLTGTLDINATGDDGSNVLIGNAGNNVLDGGLGNDLMAGGAGDDTYTVDEDDNWVTEHQDEGIDTIVRNYDTTYILDDNVENLTLSGTVFRGNGNDLDNVITGNDADNNLLGLGGNDTLIGGAGEDALFGSEGQDTLIGGTGDDYYEIDEAGDTIVENAGEGDDFVRSSVSWTLGANVERLALDGADDLYATGNGLANGLWGNDGNNLLTGGQGNDFLVGGSGDDVYLFNAGDGQDTIDNVDALGASDTLRFGAGIGENDVSAFQSGNSIFFKIRGSSDQIAISNYYAANTTSNGVTQDRKIDRIEFANGTVWDQAMIQTVVDRANNNHSPTVNSGLPTLKASQGNLFTYVVPLSTITDPDAWDSVTYTATMANGDPLPSWLTFDSQTRTFSGTPTSANIGNLQFVLWGTDNYGYGAGTYVNLTVSPPNRNPVIATPLVDQSVAEGTAISYTVPSGSFTDPDAGDSLSYTATLSDGTALPSWLSFNASTRKFTGTVPVGALDALSVRVTATDQGGLAVQDVFNIGVTVQNLALNGTTSAETLTGRSGNDTIDGKGGNDTLIGNAGNDRLIGGTGNDTMNGGTGDDTYVVDSATDIVNESAGEGTDTVESSLTLTLSANVEKLTLTGTTAINGTGNALDNVLTGNSAANTLTGNAGNDVLDGLAGADTMKGGTGDDTYYVDNVSDVVTELASEGTDTVISTLTHTLASNVENLRLNATGAINATGNALDNVLFAGAGNNLLNGLGGTDTASYFYAGSAVTVSLTSTSAQATGGSGSDTLQNIESLTGSGFNDTLTGSTAANVLDGGAGNDALIGGAGNDTYRLGRGSGSDTITENDTTAGNVDVAQFGADIATDQLWFRQVGNNLEVSVIGAADKFTLNNWYLGNQYHVEQFKTSDGRLLSDSNVQNLVQAMASFAPPAAGQTTLPPNYQSSLNTVIAANWQ